MLNGLRSFAAVTALGMSVGLAGIAQASDTTVALVPGGPHPYFAAWEQGGADAVKEFGLQSADYKVPQKWELAQQNQLLESLLSQGYNGFVIFPGDPVGSVSTAEELTSNDATVIAAGGCFKDPSSAAFCLGTDTGNSAYIGTKELARILGPGKKRILHLTGFLVDPNTQLRIDAVKKAAEETDNEVVQVIADIDAPEPAEEKINAYLAAHASEVDGVIATAWVPSVVAANALRKIGDKRIKMVGIDHDQVVLQAIKDGFVDGTMLQNPYGQAYVGSYAVNKLRSGCTVKADAPFKTNALTSKFIDSGTAFIDASQVDSYVDSMRDETKKLLESFDATYLSCN
ncbi:sugar ABC transporter substrate-binding protein [Rhizobium sp. CG4]|jgi:ribose transport system substrate-binding protein|uniref:sugar ABC transporter substrate-binding protein n=1 Tax=Rhizobium sp. CG4 TaxID=2726075 RepID=UPI0020349F31|nr:sugar ABC transporter substrate-binding protein [Rhizobium sp. CG4]MCM2457114.1 sugar ABC transporter substrate-binding protein [Rhizobium sp. CG4]